MKSYRSAWAALAAMSLVVAVILAGCSQSLPSMPKGGTLTGVEWQLGTLNGAQAPAGQKQVTAVFDAKSLSGFSGVNTYSGPYTAGADGAFKAGPLASTMMAGPPEAMQLEAGYLKALQSATSYYAADGKLTLYGSDGAPLVVYAAGKPAQLPGTKWDATGYNNGKQAVVSLAADSTITADFGTDGSVSGKASVNQYSAPYTVTGDAIKFGPATSTQMAGPPELMAQETAYLAALERATTWKVSGGRLELRDSSGALQVTYEAAK